MIKDIRQLNYVIILCDNLPQMKAFYQSLFGFEVVVERTDVLAMNAGSVTFCLRQRTRPYDGTARNPGSPGIQLAFLVDRGEVDQCHAELLQHHVTILDPPTDQFWGHRTVFFRDPEGNLLEFYEELAQ